MQADGVHGESGEGLGAAQRLLLALIRGYQLFFAPMYTGSCRFTPSCSTYAAEAVRRFGAVRGGRLAAGRLMRCRPFGGYGMDPVPACPSPNLRHGNPPATAHRN
jgi:uncharacterized protein